MRKQIRGKNEQLRKNMRKRQLQEYFKQRREQIIQFQSDPSAQKMNQQIKLCLTNANIRQIYNLLYKGETEKKLAKLAKSLSLELFNFLVLNISHIESVLLLKVLIDVHYRLIFLDKYLYSANLEFVQILFKKIHERVQQLTFNEDLSSKKQSMKYISSYLDCLRSLITNKQQIEDEYAFSIVVQPQMIERLWIYFKYLFTNPFYLLVLSLAEIDLNMTASPKVQQILLQNYSTVQKLVFQIDSKNANNITTSLPSLMLSNQITKNLFENKQFAIYILPSYMQMLKIVHSQEFANSPLEGDYFGDMLENIMLIFEFLSTELLTCHLGEILSKYNMWTFFYLLIKIQRINKQRWQVYKILKFGIKSILINKAPLKEYITQTLTSFLVEGTETLSDDIVIPCLETIQYLLYDSSKLQQEFFEWLDYYELENILENLEYSKSKQIAQMAISLIKRLQSIKQNGCLQMSIEE